MMHSLSRYIGPLSSLEKPLLNKFYRAHRSPMRSCGEQAWVVRQPDIIAALNLTCVADGLWLTGLFCAPQWRTQGIASALLQHLTHDCRQNIWLFCEPSLNDFYQRFGWQDCPQLPAALDEKLKRYQRHKSLIGLVRPAL